MLIAWMIIGEVLVFLGSLLFFVSTIPFAGWTGFALVVVGLGAYLYGTYPTRKKFWQILQVFSGGVALALSVALLEDFSPTPAFDELAVILGFFFSGTAFFILPVWTAFLTWNRHSAASYEQKNVAVQDV